MKTLLIVLLLCASIWLGIALCGAVCENIKGLGIGILVAFGIIIFSICYL